MKEKWKWIQGYLGYYKVSNHGRVKSITRYVKHRKGGYQKIRKRILKQTTDKDGYKRVDLSKKGKVKTFKVHQLVMLAFKGPCNGQDVMHLDGNPANNLLDNLRYGSRSCNQAFRVEHGTDNSGERHGYSKLTAKQVLKIRKRYAKGGVTLKKLGEKYGVTGACIYRIINRINWKHI